MPVPMSSTEIAADIAARIKTGEYPPGSRLPSYSQLTEIYAPVSVATIARVIRDLRIQGVLVGSPGRGVYVPEK